MTQRLPIIFPLFEKLGGELEALRIFACVYGWCPADKDISNWRRRRAIPADIAWMMALICADRGIGLDMHDRIGYEREW